MTCGPTTSASCRRLRKLVTARGLKFRNSFSPYPLCCPSRASFLSGQYAHNHEVLDNNAPFGFGSFDDSRTVATALQDAGYRTGFVGKYLNGYGIDRSRVTGEHSWHYVPAGWTDWYAAVQRPRRLYDRYPEGGTYDFFHTIFNVNGRTDDSHEGRVPDRRARPLQPQAGDQVQPHRPAVLPLPLGVGAAPRQPARARRRRLRPGGSDGGISEFETPARPDWVKGRFDDEVRRSPGLPANGGPSEVDVSDKPRGLAAIPS